MNLDQLPKKIEITEVGPRDGLQNESKNISLADKLKYIDDLISSGIKSLEVTSFVSPKAVPQMSDAEELFAEVQKKYATRDDLVLSCLVPNEKGYKKALNFNAESMAFFNATSDSFSKKNVNASIDQVFERITPLIQDALAKGVSVRGYISTVFGCPYEGEVTLKQLMRVVERFLKIGVVDISLGDTTGVAGPSQVLGILKELTKSLPPENIIMHFHDTLGMALPNVLVSLQNGIAKFDSSSGGLGGCPYANGATGNVATEDLCYLAQCLGVEHSIAVTKLAQASWRMLDILGKKTSSKYLQFLLNSGVVGESA